MGGVTTIRSVGGLNPNGNAPRLDPANLLGQSASFLPGLGLGTSGPQPINTAYLTPGLPTAPGVAGPNALGAAPGGGTPGAPGAPAPTSTTSLSGVATAAPDPRQTAALADVRANLAAPDPLLSENVQNIRNRMSADTTKRAMNVAGSGIDDSLAGAIQRAREAAARSGTEGNYRPEVGALTETSQRAKAAADAGIALGREGQLDSLALGANAAYTNPSQRNLALLGLEQGGANSIAGQQANSLSQALDAWRAQQQVQLTKDAQAQAAAQAQQAQALSLFNSLWN